MFIYTNIISLLWEWLCLCLLREFVSMSAERVCVYAKTVSVYVCCECLCVSAKRESLYLSAECLYLLRESVRYESLCLLRVSVCYESLCMLRACDHKLLLFFFSFEHFKTYWICVANFFDHILPITNTCTNFLNFTNGNFMPCKAHVFGFSSNKNPCYFSWCGISFLNMYVSC